MVKTRLIIKVIVISILMIIFSNYIFPNVSFGATITQEVKSGINNFPKSYQEKLKELEKLHPNWSFTAYYTGIDWNDLITNESGDTVHKRNVVPDYCDESWKCTECSPVRNWQCASKTAVEYFIDPRNFLDEVRIFQFEELSYNERIHTLESVQKCVTGTFLQNSVTYFDTDKQMNITKSYAEIILEAAKQTGMSPFHMKTKIIQEVGSNGSGSVSGTYPGYEGLYNFFNFGAYDTGDPIANALIYARDNGWTNPYVAIIGGAQLIADKYINQGQNTSYFFKFDVVGDSIIKEGQTGTADTGSLYWHQYMTNLMDPYSQSSSVYNMYAANGLIETNLNFIIPVYNNMPNEYEEKNVELDDKNKTLKTIPGVEVETVMLEAEIANYEILDAKGKKTDGTKLATGYKLNVLKDDKKTVEKTYTIIKMGDVNGDAKVNASDALAALKHSMGTATLKGNYLKATDANGDGKTNASDALLILKISMGIETLSL
ncbi:MAG: hypothetical protein IKP28_01415 [Clostridia bacterium]|nr:hypothetical protein [Clostridia bacterium]